MLGCMRVMDKINLVTVTICRMCFSSGITFSFVLARYSVRLRRFPSPKRLAQSMEIHFHIVVKFSLKNVNKSSGPL